ncbi:MAG: DUF455 family protein [Leptospiraceae bacterium]|nr:DUF455 family protein [Leptospiraceae bacterium]
MKTKIPRLEHLNSVENRAISFHHFANHELMAIELFALALLKFQDAPKKVRKSLFRSLKDEQLHFTLYLNRMREMGMDFGDRPLNSVFWKQAPKIDSVEKFAAIVAISFEGANLDFAILYKNIFLHFDDRLCADIMEKIYRDEVSHVKRGLYILRNSEKFSENDWDTYTSLLDEKFTPRRAKGYCYFPDSRRQVGLDEIFIENLGKYSDEFSKRKPQALATGILNEKNLQTQFVL